jgi:TonB family protein
MKNRKDDIERYLRGELSPAEMHALEREALDDPFLAEALEGMEQAGAENFLHDLHGLNRKVHHRAMQRKHRATKMFGWTAGLAATVLLVAVSGFLVISLLNEQNASRQALREEELLLIETSTDTLIVMFPAEGLLQAKQLKHTETPSELETRPRKSSPRQNVDAPQQKVDERADETQPLLSARDESSETARDESSETDESRETRKAATDAEVESKVEQEPIGIAAVDDEENAAGKEKEVVDPVKSKKLDGRTAGVQSRQATPPVAQSLSNDVILLKGKVTSTIDGEGLPGVNVILKGTAVGAVTDAEGNYQIPVPAAASNVVFAFIGFKTHEVTIENKEELNVTLEEDVSALSEVVIVSGYGAANNSSDNNTTTFSPAAPSVRKSDFKEYLNKAVVYPQEALLKKVEGRVTVRFTVQPDGQVTDFEVLKGIGYGCDQELIRAIKAGPAWEPASRGGVVLSDKVKVRYRFELP